MHYNAKYKSKLQLREKEQVMLKYVLGVVRLLRTVILCTNKQMLFQHRTIFLQKFGLISMKCICV